MRLEDFEKYVENLLSALFTEEVPYLSFIHGHGTGVLKKWLRDRIKRDHSLSYEVPDGNDGSTIVKTILTEIPRDFIGQNSHNNNMLGATANIFWHFFKNLTKLFQFQILYKISQMFHQ